MILPIIRHSNHCSRKDRCLGMRLPITQIPVPKANFSKRKKFFGKKVIPQGLQTINSSIKTICRHVNI